MVTRTAWTVLALLGAAAAASAQSLAPTVAVLHQADRERNSVVIKTTLLERQPVTKRVRVEVNGRVEEQTVTELVAVSREVIQTLFFKEIRGYSGDGKELPAKELWQRLRPNAVVVLGDERLLRAPFNGVFRPEVILLLSKAPTAPEKGP